MSTRPCDLVDFPRSFSRCRKWRGFISEEPRQVSASRSERKTRHIEFTPSDVPIVWVSGGFCVYTCGYHVFYGARRAFAPSVDYNRASNRLTIESWLRLINRGWLAHEIIHHAAPEFAPADARSRRGDWLPEVSRLRCPWRSPSAHARAPAPLSSARIIN